MKWREGSRHCGTLRVMSKRRHPGNGPYHAMTCTMSPLWFTPLQWLIFVVQAMVCGVLLQHP